MLNKTAAPCVATLAVSVSFTSKLAYYIQKFWYKKKTQKKLVFRKESTLEVQQFNRGELQMI